MTISNTVIRSVYQVW